MSSQYFYTQNGQQRGPVSGAQLKELADAGKIAAADYVCREGAAKWIPAGEVKGLFPEVLEAVVMEETPAPAAAQAAHTPHAGPRFHYRRDGQQVGPVALAELKELASAGRLHPDESVWQVGTAAWAPAARIEGLFPGRRCQVNGVSFLHPRD
jgi:hypothetical protein